MKDTTIETDSGKFWRLTGACIAVLVPLNWTWYVWARGIPGSLTVYVILGSALYFGLLRLVAGIRFLDISYEARFIVISSVLLLIFFLAFGRSDTYQRVIEPWIPKDTRAPLLAFFYFAASSVLLRFAIPYLLVRFKLGEDPRAYGYVIRGGTRYRWIYFGLFVIMVPLVLWASTLPEFQASYPQTRGIVTGNAASVRLFVLYHAAYFLMFLSGESFWRGYMTFGLGRDLDVLALPWMVILYSVGHYGKPILEVNGSIIAGFVLGYLALRHRSFFLGALLHWSIALTMDLAVLWQRGIVWN